MRNIYTVTQINSYIKNVFTEDYLLRSVYVKGEISNCKYHTSGHIYFTLKDEKGTIACVMFAGNRAGLGFRLEQGQRVVVGGTVDVYERDGKYQLYAKDIILDGAGLLYERYEQLKKQLAEMGMFAEEYKQPIPRYIRTLGVVTAPTGAAVRDIINIAKRRNPYIQIILYPAIVQGEQAPASIINGIHALEHLGVDTMIIGRGGGSIEDLWAFNEEAVAQAVFDCTVPIISAVGHETDTTITDYVADLRAPTPSAAAELAVCDYAQLMEKIAGYKDTLTFYMKNRLQEERTKVQACRMQLRYLSPANQLQERRTALMNYEDNLEHLMQRALTAQKHQLSLYIEQLRGLSPLDKLSQGYAFVEKENGEALHDVKALQAGDKLQIYLKNGKILAKALEIKETDYGGEGSKA